MEGKEMKKFSDELIEKAKQAQNADELLALLKANGMPIGNEEAEKLFTRLNPKQGELSDDELDNVSGGGCGQSNNVKPVNMSDSCPHYLCNDCLGGLNSHKDYCWYVEKSKVVCDLNWAAMFINTCAGCSYYVESSDGTYYGCSCPDN